MVWMWKNNPVNNEDAPYSFVATYPAFIINTGTFDDPEWLYSDANWGMWNIAEKPGEVTVPSIIDWNGDTFGDIFIGERDITLNVHPYHIEKYPPFYLDIADPNFTHDVGGTSWERHFYHKYHSVTHPDSVNPLFIEDFPMDPSWPDTNYHHASPVMFDLDSDDTLEIIAGQNYGTSGSPSSSGSGRITFWDYNGSSWTMYTSGDLPLFPSEQITIWEDDNPNYYYSEDSLITMPRNYRQRANPAVGDINGDGYLELVVGTVCGRLKCYTNTDVDDYLEWEDETEYFFGDLAIADYDSATNHAVGGNTSPSLFDFDFDGDLDLFVWDEDGPHLFLNSVAPTLIEVTCDSVSSTEVEPGSSVTFYWSIENVFDHDLYITGRMVGNRRDNHPYLNPVTGGRALYSESGTIPDGAEVHRQINFTFPTPNPVAGIGDQRFYLEVEVTGSPEQCNWFPSKARDLAIITVEDE